MYNQTITGSLKGSFAHILQTFTISLLFAFAGMLISKLFVPDPMIVFFIIAELVMIIAAVVIRVKKNKGIGYSFLFAFTTISGVTLYPVVKIYGSVIGADLVLLALLITTAMFGGLSVYAYFSKTNFRFLGGFLLASTIGLILLGIMSLFISFGGFTNLLWSAFGILVFSGWVLYDISEYKHCVPAEEVPFAALNLYLDFVNLFLYVLRFIASIVGDD